jgi:hypothetical protein
MNESVYINTPIRYVDKQWIEHVMLHLMTPKICECTANKLGIERVEVDESAFHAISGEDFYAVVVLPNLEKIRMHVAEAIEKYPEAIEEYMHKCGM